MLYQVETEASIWIVHADDVAGAKEIVAGLVGSHEDPRFPWSVSGFTRAFRLVKVFGSRLERSDLGYY